MADATLNCPTCGRPLKRDNRFVRMIVCQYCENLCEVTDEGLTPAGSMGKLVPLPTMFRVGLTGKLRGKFFQVLGRVRYRYDEGMWEEWYLGLENGAAAWLEEDEGEWTLAQVEPLQGPAPPFEQA